MRFYSFNIYITSFSSSADAAVDTSSTGIVSNSSAGCAVDAALAVLRGRVAAFKGSGLSGGRGRDMATAPFGFPPRRRQRRRRFERLRPRHRRRRRGELVPTAPEHAVEKDDGRSHEVRCAFVGAWKGEVGACKSVTVEVPSQQAQ